MLLHPSGDFEIHCCAEWFDETQGTVRKAQLGLEIIFVYSARDKLYFYCIIAHFPSKTKRTSLEI